MAFETAAPALAATGRRLLCPNPVGFGFLATVRHRDGGPRVHPVCPVITDGGLFVFVVNLSPKYRDLTEDGRYALHCFPPDPAWEEFYVTGRATEREGVAVRSSVTDAAGGRLGNHDFERLFELDLSHVLHTRWRGWGTADTWPEYNKWHG